MGLRFKLGLYSVLFVIGVLIAMGFYWQRSEHDIYFKETKHRAVALLQAFAIPCAIAVANHDTPALDNFIVEFVRASRFMDLRYMAVLDHQGKVMAHTISDEFGKIYRDKFSQQALKSEKPLLHLDDSQTDPLLEVAVPLNVGLRWGALRAGFSLDSVERAIMRGRLRLLVLGGALALVAALVAYWGLSKLVVQPVMRMRAMAQRFGAGDLNARVALNNADEMGHLATSLNGMAQQIQDYAASLEKLVLERTHALESANQKLRQANERLEHLATTDALTGLYNRRYVLEQLEFEIQRGRRSSQHAFGLLLLDIDHFKHYNDSHGHPAGDALLLHFASLVEENLRGTDVVARYGGEEFIILLLDTDYAKGCATAQKLQQLVASTPFLYGEQQPTGRLTVSVGASFYPHDGLQMSTLIERADEALYRAKALGRNQLVTWGEVRKLKKPIKPTFRDLVS